MPLELTGQLTATQVKVVGNNVSLVPQLSVEDDVG